MRALFTSHTMNSKRQIMRLPTILLLILFVAIFLSCNNNSPQNSFRFVFMTDIHLQPELRATEGFQEVVKAVNGLNPKPDFVITGGDLVYDALGQSFARADSLFKSYKTICKTFQMPVYDCLGNHDVFGIYKSSGIEPDHPEYGKTMFKQRLGNGNTYRSFNFGNWHFILLDPIGLTEENNYNGEIDDEQLAWLKEDLATVGSERPVAIVLHMPIYSAFHQLNRVPRSSRSRGALIANAREVAQLCSKFNVRLVLQGHLHIVEEIIIRHTHYITAGAVCANWWKGPYHGFEEGFVVVDVEGGNFSWQYKSLNWQAED